MTTICGTCGAHWKGTHVCPNAPRSTSAPQLPNDSLKIILQRQIRSLNVQIDQAELRLDAAHKELNSLHLQRASLEHILAKENL